MARYNEVMIQKQGLHRKKISLLAFFLGLFLLLIWSLLEMPSASVQASVPLPNGSGWKNLVQSQPTPEAWLHWALKLEKVAQNLFYEASGNIQLETIRKLYDDPVFDHATHVKTEDGEFQVMWDSKKSGLLPSPQFSKITATVRSKKTIQNYEANFEEKIIFGQQYFKASFQFSITTLEGQPLRRGFAEIFKDVLQQQTKISTSTIEGPADMRPSDMTQINIQITRPANGIIFLKKDESDPLRIPKKQDLFCLTLEKEWVLEGSSGFNEFCAPLLENDVSWHGFSFTKIPAAYESFFKK